MIENIYTTWGFKFCFNKSIFILYQIEGGALCKVAKGNNKDKKLNLNLQKYCHCENTFYKLDLKFDSNALCLCVDGVPSSQNPTVAIESWINHNKVEREEFSCILQENLKVAISTAEEWF